MAEMRVGETTLERALLEIYEMQGLQAGGCLSIATLQRAWHRTGLRSNDFRDAIRVLLQRGCLEVHDRRDVMDLALTSAGAARIRAEAFHHPSRDGELDDVRKLALLRERAMPTRRFAWDGSRRRRDDEPQIVLH